MTNVFKEQEYRFAIQRPDDKTWLVSCQGCDNVLLADTRGDIVATISPKTLLNKPQGLWLDTRNKELYVVDRNGGCVFVFNKEFDHVRTIGKGLLKEPVGIAVLDDVLCVADNENHRIVFFEKDGCDEPLFMGSYGAGRGELYCPCGIASFGNLLIVAEWGNGRIQVFQNKKSILVIEGCAHAHSVTVTPAGVVYYAMYSRKQIGTFKIEIEAGEPRFVISNKLIDVAEPPTSLVWCDEKLGIVTSHKIIFIKPT